MPEPFVINHLISQLITALTLVPMVILTLLDNAPPWATKLLGYGIIALVVGLGLVIWGSVRRDQGNRRR